MKKIFSLLPAIFIVVALHAQKEADRTEAFELIRQGDRHIGREEYVQAEEAFSRARFFFEKQGDCRQTAYCYLWLGEAAYGKGRYQEALQLGLKAEAIAHGCAGRDTFSFFSLILQNNGVFYSRLGDFDRQMAYYRKAFDQIMIRDGRKSERGADAYFNLGAAYGRRGQWDRSIAYFDTSLQIATVIGYRDGIAPLYLNLSYAYQVRKDYFRAIEYQEKALKMASRREELGRGYNNLGMLYSDLGDSRRALYFLRKAQQLRQGIYPPYHDDVISTRVNLARVYFESGRLASADSLIGRIIRELRATGVPDQSFLKVAYHYKAVLEQRMGRLDEAERYARQAMTVEGRQLRIDGSTRLILSGILFERGRYEEALGHIQAGLSDEVEGFSPGPGYDNPPLNRIQNTGMVLDLLSMKAQLLASRGSRKDLGASLATYNLIDSLVAYSRRTFQDNRSRELLSAGMREIYSGAVEAANSMYRLTRDTAYFDLAFRYSEKNRALLVLEKIHDLYAKDFYGMPAGIVGRERRLLQDIEFLTNRIREEAVEPSPDGLRRTEPDGLLSKVQRWKDRLFELRQQQEKLFRELRRDHPEYYALKHEPLSAKPSDIQRRLIGRNEVLLEYLQAGAFLYIFVIGPDKRDLVRVAIPGGDLRKLAGAFHESLLSQDDAFYEQSHALYRLLLEPVKSRISGKDLVIIPDGVLGYIPFEALLTGNVPPALFDNHRELPYVIRQHGIRYSLSASLLLANRSLKTGKQDGVLGMAPRFNRPELPALPGSDEEMDLLEERFRGHFWRGKDALESRFKASGGDYGLLHIATHTLVNDTFPSLSKLVFSMPDAGGEDGYLNAYELYNLRLNAGLVVLSACNTGTGAIQEGEGIASLARAFAYAGCPNLVVSLWPVRDRSTARLMAYYYDQLAAGADKSTGLRQAKLKYLEQENELFLHPFYWAAFVYNGDRLPIPLKSKRQGLLYTALPFALVFSMLAAALAIWRRRRH